ncbi:chemerin-like receptor 1 [Salminus brasiliensis]|uniref:chemerin-like receptor 1 n=1 Tax=Salminus brasiliensis TaxID=930266 RepID=UPI003B831D87
MTSLPVTETGYSGFENQKNLNESSPICLEINCIFYAVVNSLIFILGIAGNGLVIWIAGFKMKKSVISTWYLSLAVSDFIFCCTLPFGVIHKVQKDWIFGLFMCKFRYFIKFINMYSSIFIFAIISVDRCVVVMFPVWAQNQRTVKKAFLTVLLVWIISTVLSMPLAIFRDIEKKKEAKRCFNNYINDQSRIASVACRAVFGFVIPLYIIITSYAIIMRKLKFNQMAKKSKKPFKIMTVLIVTFFICWMPFHTFTILHIKYRQSHFVKIGKTFGITLANANSCINPFLYAFMGKDFKKQCYAVLSKIENAIEEESQYRVQGKPVTMSGESYLSVTV